MSILSFLSYSLLFTVFLGNAAKLINIRFLNLTFFGILFGFFGASVYLTDIRSHEYYLVFITLLAYTMYNLFLIKKKRENNADLFIYAGSYLLPLYLLISTKCWEQVIVITLIEALRLVSSSTKSLRQNKLNILNFFNGNFKILLLVLANVVTVSITKSDNYSLQSNIEELFIGLPIFVFYLLSFTFFGAVNSQYIEINNIKNYRSKNIFAYFIILKVLIPFVLLKNIKQILVNVSYENLIQINIILFIATIGIFLYILKNIYFYKENLNLNLYNLLVLPVSYIYITSNSVSNELFVNYLLLLATIFTLKVLIDFYQVKYKKTFLYILNCIVLLSPILSIFFNNLDFINKINQNEYEFVRIILTFIMFTPCAWIIPEIKKLEYIRGRENKFVNGRVLFLILCISVYTISLL